jgi:hypothetical protein
LLIESKLRETSCKHHAGSIFLSSCSPGKLAGFPIRRARHRTGVDHIDIGRLIERGNRKASRRKLVDFAAKMGKRGCRQI